MSTFIWRHRKVLIAMTRLELAKRYSGSVLGMFWVALYPILFLAIYLFVYLVVFNVRFPGYSDLDYVLYVFCGLIPYIGFMEAVNSGTAAIKQNIHLVKNVMLPIEIIPVRYVLVSMVTQMVGMMVLFALLLMNGSLSIHALWLPVVLVLQFMFLTGLVWVLAGLAVALMDVSYFVNLLTLLLVFISPIGFRPDMVPEHMSFIVYLNPIHYMMEAFRASLVYGRLPTLVDGGIFVAMSLSIFAFGALFFRKFKGFLLDYE